MSNRQVARHTEAAHDCLTWVHPTEHFASLTDPRVDHTKRHQLLGILTIALCAIISGADEWVAMEQFGSAKREWFDTFLTLPNGISVVLRHFALNLLKQEQTAKVGIKNTRLKVAWDERYLLKVIAG